MEARCIQEVHDLHAFFQRWFAGREGGSGEGIRRFADALSPDFRMITPGGLAHDKAQIVRIVRGAYGGRESNFRIEIKAPSAKRLAEDVCLVAYQEWQHSEGGVSCRVASAVFRADADGVRWVHLHETWLPDQAER